MSCFYGIYHQNGSNVVDSDGNRLGIVHVFNSRSDRDAWVSADVFDGNYHRAAITSKEARECMVSDPFFDWNRLDRIYHYAPDEVRFAPMSAIVDCYAIGL